MAYSGYLVKLGSGNNSEEIPLEYIQYDTYQATYQMIDVDSGESTQSGQLERTVLKRRKMKIEWNTPPLTGHQLNSLLQIFRDHWIDADAQKIHVTAFIPFATGYREDDCYLTADMNFQIRYIDTARNILYYEPIRFALIGYSTASATRTGN